MSGEKQSFMLLVAGFFGSLIALAKEPKNNTRDTIFAISAGTSCAYFLTPLVFELLNIDATPNVQSGMAFLLGILGMRTVELLVQKIFPDSKSLSI